MGIHSKLDGLQLFLADDTFNGHARLALIEHKGLRMEDAPPVFYMGVDSNAVVSGLFDAEGRQRQY